ncbi:hypothetical protein AB9K34_08185 [Sedimentitalea sp. XS_ASV28]|uniref:hypothetical protein n=1 Tax=Sedimentitalea sp. XS_ASV28 TaxID=3241296 RepID=UPI0035157596
MQIKHMLINLSRSGRAVIVIPEELEELFQICDRLCVSCNGDLSSPLADHRRVGGLLMTDMLFKIEA